MHKPGDAPVEAQILGGERLEAVPAAGARSRAMGVPAFGIAAAATSPPGSVVKITGVAIAVRRLGRLNFILVKDSFSEIQAMIPAAVAEANPIDHCPCYVSLSGVLRERPGRDARPEAVNGLVEIEVEALQVHGSMGQRPLGVTSGNVWRLVAFLQSKGFLDIRTLVTAHAPSCRDLLDAQGPDPAIHLAYMLGPCRWFLLTASHHYFGISPGSVSDLRGCLGHGDEPADPAVREMIEGASWHQWRRGNSPNPPPLAYGKVALAHWNGAFRDSAGGAYWRGAHEIAHISETLLSIATVPPTFDDVMVRSLVESVERTQAIVRSTLGTGKAGVSVSIPMNFPEFDMHAEHIKRMFSLFPSFERRLAHLEPDRQFELLWSILGHDHVKSIFSSSDAIELLTAGVEAGLFADFNVLRHIDHVALESIRALSRDFDCGETIKKIGNLFASTPGCASSACQLMEAVDRAGLEWERCLPVARNANISVLAFFAVALGLASAQEITLWRDVLASRLKRLFTNDPVDEEACRTALTTCSEDHCWIRPAIEACSDFDLGFDLVHLTYGNGLVMYEEAARMYRRAEDCSRHWAAKGIQFGGERWNAAEGRYELTGLEMYPSKNRAAILAKSCSGICSARNFELFHRPDHFQFTLVDPAGPAAAGSVQLYTHHDAHGRTIWVLRGLNPSERVDLEPVGLSIELLDTLASLARNSGIGSLVCGDGFGLFNADSARLPIRTILRRLAENARQIRFDRPLHLFDYHDRPISIDHGWQVWP